MFLRGTYPHPVWLQHQYWAPESLAALPQCDPPQTTTWVTAAALRPFKIFPQGRSSRPVGLSLQPLARGVRVLCLVLAAWPGIWGEDAKIPPGGLCTVPRARADAPTLPFNSPCRPATRFPPPPQSPERPQDGNPVPTLEEPATEEPRVTRRV